MGDLLSLPSKAFIGLASKILPHSAAPNNLNLNPMQFQQQLSGLQGPPPQPGMNQQQLSTEG